MDSQHEVQQSEKEAFWLRALKEMMARMEKLWSAIDVLVTSNIPLTMKNIGKLLEEGETQSTTEVEIECWEEEKGDKS